MSTVTLDKKGKAVTPISDTAYHPDGTGPRDADGKPIAAETAADSPAVPEATSPSTTNES